MKLFCFRGVKFHIFLLTFGIVLLISSYLWLKYKLCKHFEEQWPDLELFLPLEPSTEGISEFQTLLLPSLAIFWPKRHNKLVIVTDEEKLRDFTFVYNSLIDYSNLFQTFRIVGNEPLNFMNGTGWHRQQWLCMWADNYTKAQYVGFVDTDTVFVTRVLVSDIFKDGKPIVRAHYGKPRPDSWWDRAPEATFHAIGKKEPFKCMTYFPVVIKVKHLPLMREHIRKSLRNRDYFDQTFRMLMQGRYYSQFNLMCAYLWYHHRDEYHWLIDELEPGWSGKVIGQVETPEEAGITEFLPLGPHLAVHWTYENFGDKKDALRRVLISGICFAAIGRMWNVPYFCKDFQTNNVLNSYEWVFEGNNFSDRPGSMQAHQHRMLLMDKEVCPFEPNWDFIPVQKYS